MCVTLSSHCEFLPLGAIIKSFYVGGINIVQGFPTQHHYQKYNSPFFGETIGRVANRVANAEINSLNHRHYPLTKSDGEHSLHGGLVGWGKRIWDGPRSVHKRGIPGLTSLHDGGDSVMFRLESCDDDEGYPGSVEASVIYTTGTQHQNGKEVTVLSMEYEVQLLDDDANGVEETVVNMTNHSYFNLCGNSTIEGTVMSLCTNTHLLLDQNGIPTTSKTISLSDIAPNELFTLGETKPDFDHCFIVNPSTESRIPLDTRPSELTRIVTAYHPQTQIHLEILSTEPAFQFYTGDYVDVPATAGVPARGSRAGFCVEPSRYVNAINQEEWRDQVMLKKGQVYGCRTVYRGWSDL
ncbi:Bifunctional protein GAL10 [Golovinomyces cichoracearum]|uniref:Bifunctional protein GAL10 n=1 Tax=Golovinomyces cichoracearum TaxID=62708 RepID=A0A420IPS3_9PEZI|nr:Bifunctional protein GAL10 [Golovinomyces cichoracearum]